MSNKLKKKTDNNSSSYNKIYTSNNGFVEKFYNILQKEKKNIDIKSHSRHNIIDSITMIFIELIMLFIIFNRFDILYELGGPENSTFILFSMALIFFSIKDIVKAIIRIKNKEAILFYKIIIVINGIFSLIAFGSIIYF